jgi:hypothetical protein
MRTCTCNAVRKTADGKKMLPFDKTKDCAKCFTYETDPRFRKAQGGDPMDVLPIEGKKSKCSPCEARRRQWEEAKARAEAKAANEPKRNRTARSDPRIVEPRPNPNPWVYPIRVPPPPPWTGKPKEERALLTVAGGEKGKSLLELTGPFMERYAKKHKADFVVLSHEVPQWGVASKFGMANVLPHYKQVVYVDADVLLRDSAADLFQAGADGRYAAVSELDKHLIRPEWGVVNVYKRFLRFLREEEYDPHFYINSGVQVLTKEHGIAVQYPPMPVPPQHLTEQNLVNHRLRKHKIRINLLPVIYNWQHWHDIDFLTAPDNAVLHFSGMGTRHEERITRIKDFIANRS